MNDVIISKRRADRLIKHPWERCGFVAVQPVAHARGAEQAMPPGPTLDTIG